MRVGTVLLAIESAGVVGAASFLQRRNDIHSPAFGDHSQHSNPRNMAGYQAGYQASSQPAQAPVTMPASAPPQVSFEIIDRNDAAVPITVKIGHTCKMNPPVEHGKSLSCSSHAVSHAIG